MRLYACVCCLLASSMAAAETCARIDPKPNVLVVEGSLGGRKVRVFIDTGGSGGVSTRLAHRLRPIPGQTARYAGASGTWRESPIYEVAGLRLGGVELAPFRAISLPARVGAATEGGYDVMIGIPELKKYVVEIDLRENRFCLHETADPALTMRPIELTKNGTIIVPAKLGERGFDRFILDTGAGVSTLSERFLAEIPHKKRPEHVISVDGSGVRKKEFFVEIEKLCLFDRCKPKQVVMPGEDLSALNGFRVDGIVGMSFLKGSRLVLDLPRSQLAIG